jgi:hypothetical protein
MDGKQLTQAFLDAVDKAEADLLELQPRAIYQALDLAAIEFARQTRILTKTATLTMVMSQQRYDLPPDFLTIYPSSPSGRLLGKYTDTGGTVYWPVAVDEGLIFQDDDSATNDSPPEAFAIVPRQAAETRITGTTTSAGAATGGEATLTDAVATFTGAVEVRDRVHDATKESSGIVIAVAAHALTCCMFGGISAAFGSGDAYVIVPAATQQALLDAPAAVAGETLVIPYICAPPPVFSDYASWPFKESTCQRIAQEAAFQYLLHKRQGKPREADHQMFNSEITQTKREIALNILKTRSS